MREFKIGQMAWSPLTGWGEVELYEGSLTYPLLHNGITYTEDGKSNKTNLRPTLFHNEVPESEWPNPEPPPELLPELAVDDKIWVRNIGHNNWSARHFAKWDTNRAGVFVWIDGKTSFTTRQSIHYLYWKLDDGSTNYSTS